MAAEIAGTIRQFHICEAWKMMAKSDENGVPKWNPKGSQKSTKSKYPQEGFSLQKGARMTRADFMSDARGFENVLSSISN